MQSTAQVLANAVRQSHWLINAVFADVDDELASRPAPGNANPLGTAYAHIAFSEDAVLHGMIHGAPPLFVTTRSGRTGCDKPMPMPTLIEGDMGEWYRTARVDVDQLRDYSAEVFAATEAFLDGASDEDLAREVDLSAFDMGMKTVADVVTMLICQHCDNYSGEISAIKGTFGLRGYPF